MPRTRTNGGKNAAITAKVADSPPPFDTRSFLTSVSAGRSSAKYAPKDIVFRQGDPADAVFYIQKGKVQLMVLSEHGKEGVVGNLEAGEFFGEGCLAGQALHMTTASAAAELVVIRIEKDVMIRVLREQPDLSAMFLAYLLTRNIQFEADLVDQLFNSSERRLARLLLLLANFAKDGKMEAVIPKVSQEILAAKIGTTRSRINFFMNKFRRLGLIEYSGELKTLKVHTSLLNVVVHD
jgi:CRP/FNR family transcriptional regulator, cyclic AMP receptor protein